MSFSVCSCALKVEIAIDQLNHEGILWVCFLSSTQQLGTLHRSNDQVSESISIYVLNVNTRYK